MEWVVLQHVPLLLAYSTLIKQPLADGQLPAVRSRERLRMASLSATEGSQLWPLQQLTRTLTLAL